MRKHYAFFEKHGITSISFLFNNAHEVEDFIIAGTRGWYYDEDASNIPSGTDFEKLTKREEMRLRASLNEAVKLKEASPEKEIIVFTHFPPVFNGKAAENIVAVLKEYGIKRMYYGHLHGNYTMPAVIEHEGIKMNLISADYLEFIPKFIARD